MGRSVYITAASSKIWTEILTNAEVTEVTAMSDVRKDQKTLAPREAEVVRLSLSKPTHIVQTSKV